MAILVDLNQVMIAALMAQLGNHQNAQVDENMIRHMILNSIRSNRKKFKDEYGELIICADDKNYWRRSYFPYYKANRKTNRDKSELDWNAIFAALNQVREELKTNFPYKVIQIEHAEADDIIGTIVHAKGTPLAGGEKILILSGDKDYVQLHGYGNVAQYDPTRKRWIKSDDPDKYLAEHILKGDRGDGVPNVLSQDNCFVMNIRQKPLTAKKMEELADINRLNEEQKRNYARNKKLIDLKEVPQDIKDQVIDRLNTDENKGRSGLLTYFMDNKLKHLMSYIGDF